MYFFFYPLRKGKKIPINNNTVDYWDDYINYSSNK